MLYKKYSCISYVSIRVKIQLVCVCGGGGGWEEAGLAMAGRTLSLCRTLPHET